jgi:hypothetical protein
MVFNVEGALAMGLRSTPTTKHLEDISVLAFSVLLQKDKDIGIFLEFAVNTAAIFHSKKNNSVTEARVLTTQHDSFIG